MGVQEWNFYGLLLSCLGAVAMFPAIEIGVPESSGFYYVLIALFIVGLGFSLQQIAANPFAISLGNPSKGAHRLNLAGGINSLGTTIGPLVIALILFGSTPKSELELQALIANDQINLSTIQILYMAVGGLFLLAAALFHFSKKLPQATNNTQYLRAPKAQSALLIMTVLLIACFVLIFEQYRGEPNNDFISNDGFELVGGC